MEEGVSQWEPSWGWGSSGDTFLCSTSLELYSAFGQEVPAWQHPFSLAPSQPTEATVLLRAKPVC